jgi:hypothetical protein
VGVVEDQAVIFDALVLIYATPNIYMAYCQLPSTVCVTAKKTDRFKIHHKSNFSRRANVPKLGTPGRNGTVCRHTEKSVYITYKTG